MIDTQDRIEAVAEELDEARRVLEAARATLLRAEEGGAEPDALRRAAARIDRIAAEVARIERVCAGRLPEASGVG
ncbi:hypothetical protein [Tautonia plasticadhaerens]|uniref:Uncharacterized protein n=1 Tax=Tautonia plasticadhaerens TaxID=2527974 RepID=A0A518HEI0_9BACT|nr:hypothetical protein [Tautonia plasticadhaerens]QDV39247.1 hypothetical protein ElP_72110 [Tautonia plasticadhaerens]